VLERREILGGAAGTEEVFPGFKVNTGTVDAGMLLPQIAADLNLDAHGLRWIEPPALVSTLLPGGEALTLWRDPHRTAEEMSRFSTKDAARYLDFLRQVGRYSAILSGILAITPPSLPKLRAGEVLPWLNTALQIKRLGSQDMMEFLRVLPMSAADFLDEWFESEAVKAAIGASSVTGTFQGPRSSGTALMLLYQAVNAGAAGICASRFVQAGIGRLSGALAQAARLKGAEIRTGVEVSRVLVESGQAVGVELSDGAQLRCRAVASSLDPQRTLFGMVGAQHLELRMVREVKNIRLRASLARVNLAVNGLPPIEFTGSSSSAERLAGRLWVCPSLEYLEKAYDGAKYGDFSAAPALEITIPTIADPSLAPPGAHLLQINVYYAPYALNPAEAAPPQASRNAWEARRQELLHTVLKTLETYTPDLAGRILHSQVVTPVDIERLYGLTNGDIYQGQMGLDQLLAARPIAGFTRYRMPVAGLYLCGSAAHPGGGVTGAPGYNAAREMLRDLA
jgi:phytoene dehydrogenase-like protein